MIDPIASGLITRELTPNERLLWAGRPQQGVLFRGADIFLVPLSLLWCGFAIFWESSVISTGAPFFFKLWGIPFVLVGLYVVIGRFFVDAKQRAKTFYGLTDNRVIIVSGLFQKKIKSLNLQTISDVSLSEKANKKGTVTFGPTLPFYWAFAGSSWPGAGQQAVPCFETIENARTVYDLISNAQKTSNIFV
jgi:hypothetical protein